MFNTFITLYKGLLYTVVVLIIIATNKPNN